jgi:proteasome lid subunit RPN8/RPN11
MRVTQKTRQSKSVFSLATLLAQPKPPAAASLIVFFHSHLDQAPRPSRAAAA